ncbi:unnamed protein product, partial [Rotaria sp. Silwood2]
MLKSILIYHGSNSSDTLTLQYLVIYESDLSKNDDETLIDYDFKREMLVYPQVQSTVLEGILRLETEKISIKPLDNYFALVITSEKHMIK